MGDVAMQSQATAQRYDSAPPFDEDVISLEVELLDKCRTWARALFCSLSFGLPVDYEVNRCALWVCSVGVPFSCASMYRRCSSVSKLMCRAYFLGETINLVASSIFMRAAQNIFQSLCKVFVPTSGYMSDTFFSAVFLCSTDTLKCDSFSCLCSMTKHLKLHTRVLKASVPNESEFELTLSSSHFHRSLPPCSLSLSLASSRFLLFLSHFHTCLQDYRIKALLKVWLKFFFFVALNSEDRTSRLLFRVVDSCVCSMT